MKIKQNFLFKPTEPKLKVIKQVTVYLSDKHNEIIIASCFKDPKTGVNYEQPNCEVIGLNSSSETIGVSVKDNFSLFDIKSKDFTKSKKSDWPAFNASKEKTMRGFEKYYRRISIRGITNLNNSLRLETVMNLPLKIELTSTISAHCEPIDLGNRIIKMFQSEITEQNNKTK